MDLADLEIDTAIHHQSALDVAREAIYAVDLSEVISRLVNIENWSRKDATEAVGQYRNYLFLRKKYPQFDLPPSKDIDEVWHAHILHTQDYRRFCKQVFNNEEDCYLDHHPHLAKVGSLAKLQEQYERTLELYEREFGEPIYQITGRSLIKKAFEKIGAYFRKKAAQSYTLDQNKTELTQQYNKPLIYKGNK